MKNIEIYSILFNNKSFIEYQAKTFKKFLKEDFNLNIVDNSNNNTSDEIENLCFKNQLKYIRINNNPFHGNPSFSHSHAVQYIFENHVIKNNDEMVIITEFDVFLIKYFSLRNYLLDYDIAGIHQKRGSFSYLHPGLIIMDNKRLPNKHEINFSPVTIDNTGLDTGGGLTFYLNKYKLKIKYIIFFSDNYSNKYKHLRGINYHEFNPSIFGQLESKYRKQYMMESFENIFLHFRGGSNWDNQSFFGEKCSFLSEFIEKLI